MGKTSTVFQAAVPDDIQRILQVFEVSIDLGIGSFRSLLRCLGLYSELNLFFFWIIAPFVLTFAVSVVAFAMAKRRLASRMLSRRMS